MSVWNNKILSLLIKKAKVCIMYLLIQFHALFIYSYNSSDATRDTPQAILKHLSKSRCFSLPQEHKDITDL